MNEYNFIGQIFVAHNLEKQETIYVRALTAEQFLDWLEKQPNLYGFELDTDCTFQNVAVTYDLTLPTTQP